MSAVARDAAGNQGQATDVLINIDNTPISADIIIDNEDTEAIENAGWLMATGASNNYGVNSRYALVAGAINTYTFTPNIQIAGQYEVFAWNSCFTPRNTAVPHRIVHSAGATTVFINQDETSGICAVWESLGTFSFNVGAAGYVEISDTGLSSGSYIGADAVRFTISQDQVFGDGFE